MIKKDLSMFGEQHIWSSNTAVKDQLGTHTITINTGAANESETGVYKILVHKQKEEVESMKAIFFTVA